MTIGAQTSRPIGHEQFCHVHPAECRPLDAHQSHRPLKLTPAMIVAISAVNTGVNVEIKPESDQKVYGVKEWWAYPDKKVGDCEDFALLKRRMLHEIGIDLSDLLMTVVRKRDGEGHAVLTLRTTNGDFILDNLNWKVIPWNEAPYTFLKRQDPRNPGAWQQINDGTEVLVGAVAK
ncbi:transglutaminase-like cysteine peptidase [Jiella sp. M17.18]|uniref:transglutaminase-like cysteine peptidase n=1 Tax=Jiella sp. M17.18 TaxID=3234247 RepID=UPI0034DF2E6A